MNLWIAVAMEVEEQALLRGRSAASIELAPRLGLVLKEFRLGAHTLSVCRCGIGPVNAALALAFSVERLPIDSVLLLGVGGALAPQLELGDVVVAKRVIQHDSIASGARGDELIAPGELYLSSKPEDRVDPVMPADPRLLAWIASAFSADEIHQGTILSGSEFVATPERKRAIALRHPESLLVDMEAAGVAQIARRLRIPFAVAKTVADVLTPDGTIARDYRRSLLAASEHAGRVLDRLVATFGAGK